MVVAVGVLIGGKIKLGKSWGRSVERLSCMLVHCGRARISLCGIVNSREIGGIDSYVSGDRIGIVTLELWDTIRSAIRVMLELLARMHGYMTSRIYYIMEKSSRMLIMAPVN